MVIDMINLNSKEFIDKYVGVDIDSAREKGLRFYVGAKCQHNHHPLVDGAIRYASTSACVDCQKKHSQSARYLSFSKTREAKESNSRKAARDNAELIKTAKELGISVEDLI